MRLQKRLTQASVAGVLLSVPTTCFAAAGARALAGFIQIHVIDQALLAFWGVAAAAVFYYAVRMILEAHRDEAQSNLTQSFIYVVSGFIIIACTGAFASALYSPSLSADEFADINPLLLEASILSAANFIITASSGIFVLMVVLVGLRIVATQGEQGEFDKWKKVLAANCIGVMVMFLASFIVQWVAQREPSIIIEELLGICLFLLTLIGFMSVVALIIAGVLLVVSINETLKDRAKRIVISTLITLAVVMAAYTLIITFLQ